MKTKTITLYEFDELSPEAQQKVVERMYDVNVEHEWYELTLEDEKAALAEKGYLNAEIGFSGFSSQGDGAHFTADIDLVKFPYLKEYAGKARVWIERTSRQYEHEYTVNARFEIEADMTADEQKKAETGLDAACEKLIEDARGEMKRIYRALEKEYEELTSEEAIKETIRANEWTFRENGSMENL